MTECPTPRAVCGRISAAFTVLAVFAPLIVGFLFVGAEQARPPAPEAGPEAQREAWGWLGRLLVGVAAAVAAAAISAIGGVIFGVVSVTRGERPIGYAVLGLTVCGLIVALLVSAYLSGQQ